MRGRVGLARAVVATAVGLVLLVGGAHAPASAAQSDREVLADSAGGFLLNGGGWGHGRGMSQWGAQGAALQGLSADSILGFYYPGDTVGTRAYGSLRVLVRSASTATVATAAGLTVRDAASGATFTWGSRGSRLRVVRGGAGLVVQQLTSGTWREVTSASWPSGGVAGPVVLAADGLLGVEPTATSTVRYRGEIHLHARPGSVVDVVNRLPMEQYLYSVVPAESPPFFAPAALQAQAVAARSYAQFNCSAGASHFDVLATTSCQVYRGHSLLSGGSTTNYEATTTTTAVQATKDRVLLRAGSPVRTEFSSSNGGRTAPSNTWPAKVDPYDGVDSRNSNHKWTHVVTASAIRSAWPAIGEPRSLAVLERDASTRVTRLAVNGSLGSVTVTGDTARTRLGLKSTLFTIVPNVVDHAFAYSSTSGAQAVLEVNEAAVDRTLAVGPTEPGWDMVVAIEIDGTAGDELLFYNPTEGRRKIVDIDQDGNLRTMSSGGWSKGWDVIVPVEIDGTTGDELLVYNSVTGRRWILDVSRTGGTSALQGGGWSLGWDVVVPVEVDGTPRSELVVYNSTNGRRWLLDLYSNGGMGAISGGSWSVGWDVVTPVRRPSAPTESLLFYNTVNGRELVVEVGRTGGLKQLSSRVTSPGWSAVLAMELDGSNGQEVLHYRRSNGAVSLADLSATGALGAEVTSTWPSGRDVVIGVDVPGR